MDRRNPEEPKVKYFDVASSPCSCDPHELHKEDVDRTVNASGSDALECDGGTYAVLPFKMVPDIHPFKSAWLGARAGTRDESFCKGALETDIFAENE